MLSLPDRAAMEQALTLPLRDDIKTILRLRIEQVHADGLENLTHIIVLTKDDTEDALKEEVLFSPFESYRLRYGNPAFEPGWDCMHNHGGWFEVVYCVGNSGFAFVLLIEDRLDQALAKFVQMCRSATG